MSHVIADFQLMAKPSGAVCNMDCSYCFYLEKENLYPERKNHWKMNGETLENYVKKNIISQQSDVVDFLWQGGEPTLLGVDFFREAIRLQKMYRGNKLINNFFQTNGIKLDDDWAKFLKENNFLVGLSIDGDRISNDAHRLTRAGESTYDSVMKGLAALKKYRVEFNTLTVVNAENVTRPMDVYKFLKRIGSRYMQFIPLVERHSAEPDQHGLTLVQPDFSGQCNVTQWSVPPKAYGQFLNTIFDHWVTTDLGSVFIMNFEQTLAKLDGKSGSCVMNETCGANLIVEANGDIYSCDHFVYPEHKLGNINQESPNQLANSSQHLAFSKAKNEKISIDCKSCLVRPVCNGGCPKHRFNISSDGRPNKNYLCDGYATHLHHALPEMQQIIRMLRQHISPSKIRKHFKIK